MNFSKAGKLLLTTGLLVVLAQGLWQLPELQDYLFPHQQLTAPFQPARKEYQKIQDHLTLLQERVDYLQWSLPHNGQVRRVSIDRMLAFPFSESIRPLFPGYFWHMNIYLAKREQLYVERKLNYVDALLNYLASRTQAQSSLQDTQRLPQRPGEISLWRQIQELQRQWVADNSKLNDLSKKLTWLANHGFKN